MWSSFKFFHFLFLFSVAIKPVILLLCFCQMQYIPLFPFIISIWSPFPFPKHKEGQVCFSYSDLRVLFIFFLLCCFSTLPHAPSLRLWRNSEARFSSFTRMFSLKTICAQWFFMWFSLKNTSDVHSYQIGLFLKEKTHYMSSLTQIES